jgi:hypothetical protein
MRTGKKELYNLADDIGELQDLSGRYPEKTTQIAQLLEKRLTELGAQFPQKR